MCQCFALWFSSFVLVFHSLITSQVVWRPSEHNNPLLPIVVKRKYQLHTWCLCFSAAVCGRTVSLECCVKSHSKVLFLENVVTWLSVWWKVVLMWNVYKGRVAGFCVCSEPLAMDTSFPLWPFSCYWQIIEFFSPVNLHTLNFNLWKGNSSQDKAIVDDECVQEQGCLDCTRGPHLNGDYQMPWWYTRSALTPHPVSRHHIAIHSLLQRVCASLTSTAKHETSKLNCYFVIQVALLCKVVSYLLLLQ